MDVREIGEQENSKQCVFREEKKVHAKKNAVPPFQYHYLISNFNLSGEFSHSRAFDPPAWTILASSIKFMLLVSLVSSNDGLLLLTLEG